MSDITTEQKIERIKFAIARDTALDCKVDERTFDQVARSAHEASEKIRAEEAFVTLADLDTMGAEGHTGQQRKE